MASEDRHPVFLSRTEYKRKEQQPLRPREMYDADPGRLSDPERPYAVRRRLSVQERRAVGGYATEAQVQLRDVEKVGRYYTVTFGPPSAEEQAGAEPEPEQTEETVIMSAAGYIVRDIVERGVKRIINAGYFLSTHDGQAQLLGELPERESQRDRLPIAA